MTDREHAALEAIAQTIRAYDEETIFEALRKIADRFDWELAKRDPGPDDDVESGNVWPRDHFTTVLDAMTLAKTGTVIPLRRSWS